MTVKITEVTREDRSTFGMRLQAAREAQNLTRPQVADQTGIPVKSIEKFESGLMSPNVERLQALSEVLGVSIDYLLNGDIAQPPKPPTLSPSALPVVDTSEAEHDAILIDEITSELEALDTMREKGFQNYWRSAPRQFAQVSDLISQLDLDALLDLAEARGLLAIEIEDIETFDEMDGDTQMVFFSGIEERIVDTAYFGIDLFKLETRALERLAGELELRPDKNGLLFSSWSNETALIEALREILRDQALRGNVLEFRDEKLFPRKEAA